MPCDAYRHLPLTNVIRFVLRWRDGGRRTFGESQSAQRRACASIASCMSYRGRVLCPSPFCFFLVPDGLAQKRDRRLHCFFYLCLPYCRRHWVCVREEGQAIGDSRAVLDAVMDAMVSKRAVARAGLRGIGHVVFVLGRRGRRRSGSPAGRDSPPGRVETEGPLFSSTGAFLQRERMCPRSLSASITETWSVEIRSMNWFFFFFFARDKSAVSAAEGSRRGLSAQAGQAVYYIGNIVDRESDRGQIADSQAEDKRRPRVTDGAAAAAAVDAAGVGGWRFGRLGS
jgi:hypothetical protein